MRSGVSDSETRVTIGSPTFSRQVSAAARRSRRRVPMSMPPEPVTGLCILPRVVDDFLDASDDFVVVVGLLCPDLGEAGGVDIEVFDVDENLVVPDFC